MLKTISIYIADYYNLLEAYTDILVIEYDKFMDLVFASNKQLICPEDIEKCWQALVLDTELYYQYCMRKYGKIIHYKILKLSSQERNQQIDKTYKLYINKHSVVPNKLIWSKPIFSKSLYHWNKQQIDINVLSKSGKKYFILTHGFNSVDNFGNIKELIAYKYQVSVGLIKIYVNKINLSELTISNICEFYKLDPKLEILDSINISGIYSFGVASFNLIL